MYIRLSLWKLVLQTPKVPLAFLGYSSRFGPECWNWECLHDSLPRLRSNLHFLPKHHPSAPSFDSSFPASLYHTQARQNELARLFHLSANLNQWVQDFVDVCPSSSQWLKLFCCRGTKWSRWSGEIFPHVQAVTVGEWGISTYGLWPLTPKLEYLLWQMNSNWPIYLHLSGSC